MINNFDKIVVVKKEKLMARLVDLRVEIATLELERANTSKELNELMAMRSKDMRESRMTRIKKYSSL